ncbi:TIGR03545 family protein [Colwellia sp. E2M01]|uniref:TIGR03545 family protein n=1 Tax=Colwellia sp. E2M01 TaxID=2841561 RepID=UPI001C090788|nr:TIGR03545 family protein [Colwellia sp. E2M01]MBU2871828.1 TIGR03545 family protein [Colwellia sp. E2M01]
MTKFIRWQGIIGFVAITALIISLLYFFAETLVKKGIVASAESVFGAEVNVADVELDFSPLHISVIGMQVTDKDVPTHNVFSFERASAGVDFWQYLFGKIIIEQLDVAELTFGNERNSVGQVYGDDETDKKKQSFSDKAKAMLPEMDMQLPDVKSILNDSDLITIKASKTLQASYETEQVKLEALKDNLPTKEKLKYYQDKVKALTKVDVKSLDDIAKLKADYDAIKEEFKADQAVIKDAKKQVLASKDLLAQQVTDVKNAPAKDWQNIEKKYQLETLDSEDFIHILFGEQARGHFEKAQWAYEMVAPYLGSSDDKSEEVIENKVHAKGRFIFFKEDSPLPEVLIKKSLLSMSLEQGDFVIKGTELTHQHWFRGKDSEINITSITNGELNLDSRFKFTQTGDFIADGNWDMNNRMVNDATLTDSKALSLSLEQGNMRGEGNFTLVDGDILSENHIALNQTSYQGQGTTKLTSILFDTIKSLDKLTVDVDVRGELAKPDFSISSSLNEALTGAFKQQVAGKLSEFKNKVNAGLNEKLAGALKLGNNQTAELLDLEALLTDTDKALDDLKNSDVVKQQQKKLEDKVKDKAKDKLKGKLGDLFG